MSKEVNKAIQEHWNAFLDGELSAEEAKACQTAIDSCADDAAFIEGQMAFNQALKDSFADTSSATLPASLKAKFDTFLSEEAHIAPPASTISPGPDGSAMDTPTLTLLKGGVSVGRIAAAVIIVVAISVFGTLVATGEIGFGSSTETPRTASNPEADLDFVLASSMKLMGSKGDYAGLEIIEAAYQKAGVEHLKSVNTEAYGCGLRPVMVKTSTLSDGSEYTQVCYCTCNAVAKSGPQNGKPIKQRFVLNILEGNRIPEGTTLDEMKCWTQHSGSYHSFAKYDAKSDKTYIVIVPANCDDQESEKMVRPFLV